ncbi:P-loop containing nucleoside triphosphate hydrolase protein [Pelagophyceae sp. CCMP2097]|nr:P-loop containing nucleoside triphosphate hydrolase protein [Pelagophyceae sp. CCMP2097]
MSDRQCKVVLIGDGSVGKSSIIARFTADGFRQRYSQTIGVDFFEKRISLRGDVSCKLQLWDIGGQSIGSKMLAKYLFNAHVVLCIYDLTNQESLRNIEDWLAALRRVFLDSRTGIGKMPETYIIGNKADLVRQRQVSDLDHAAFWREHGLMGGFLTSAQSGENVVTTLYGTAAHAVGVTLTPGELAVHQRCIGVNVPQGDGQSGSGRTAQADRIEAEDRALEEAKRLAAERKACSCAIA